MGWIKAVGRVSGSNMFPFWNERRICFMLHLRTGYHTDAIITLKRGLNLRLRGAEIRRVDIIARQMPVVPLQYHASTIIYSLH